MTPQDLRYAKTHEWVRLEAAPGGARLATVGITDFAIKALTDLVYLDLPKPGRQVAAGQPFGEIESVKAVSDLYSPVSGEVVEVNAAIAGNLERLAADPYQAGWLVKIRPASDAALADLMDAAAYQKQCEEEAA